MKDTARPAADDLLLLFRKVDDPYGRARAWQLLDEGMGGRAWRLGSDLDGWELRDVLSADDERPVAAAATCALGDGRRVRLLALVVAAAHRGRGIGRRTMDELVDALRALGVLVLVTAVPIDHMAGISLVQRVGFRPSHVERGNGVGGEHDLVWFDVEL